MTIPGDVVVRLQPADATAPATARELSRDVARPVSAPAQNRGIHLVPFNEITLSTGRRDLVKGLIPRVGMTVVWGPPKCGKSFWAFDLMMHVALNWPYRGRRVHQGAVVYCAFEGQTGIEQRVAAFRQTHLGGEDTAVPFYLEPVTLDLVKDHAALIAVIRQTLGDVTPVAVTLDTLNRSLAGSESSDQDMSAYVRAADAIREAFQCAVVIVHHCGHGGDRPRGHSSLMGALDAQLAVKRDATNNILVEVELMKDGAQGDIIASRLEVVTVGADVDGDPITSCIVVELDAAAAQRASRSGQRGWPNGSLRFVRNAINAALIDHGISHTVRGDGPQVRAVPVSAARAEHKRAYVSNGDGDAAANERQAWRRNFPDARSRNLICAETTRTGQELVWLMTDDLPAGPV
jgi:AAA domain